MGTRRARRRPTTLITLIARLAGITRVAGIDGVTILLAAAVVALLTIGGSGRAPSSDAAPPPAGRFAHGAAGTARNGFGGSVAPSPTIESWPGTAAGRNGGPFAFIGAQYGSLWSIPPGMNNSMGVGYCVMEDVGGEGTVALQPDPALWDAGEMARAAALTATFGGDRVVPYGIDASGGYDVLTGEWQQPSLFGGGEYTRRRQVAVNFGVKMFLEDVSPSGVAAGRKLAGDTAIVNGSGGEFAALRNGYAMAQRMVTVAERQHAVGGVTLQMVWDTPGGVAPTAAGSYPLEVRATDSTGKPVGFVPVVQLSEIGIEANRSIGAAAIVNGSSDTVDDAARWEAAEQTGWPTMDMGGRLTLDPRFSVGWNPQAADVTNEAGVARFDVSIAGPEWELAFHTQAPTANVDLHSGTGVQGQVTWSGPPQSASAHQVMTAPVVAPVGELVVRKALDAGDIQGDRDMSGFVFEVHSGGDVSGAAVGTLTTAVDGRTPPLIAPAGEYTIVEVGRPSWATGLTDGGSVTFRFDPLAQPGPLEITYRNLVPSPRITTAARDASDGDKYLTLGDDPGAIIDTITYTGLIPGTRYVARGTLMAQNARCHTWCPTPFVPTPVVTSRRFVADGANGMVDVRFEIPADTTELQGATVVVVQRVEVEASGRVVADHTDPTDLAQTVYVPTMTSVLRHADPADGVDPKAAVPGVVVPRDVVPGDVVPGDEVVDVVDYAGLALGARYRMELTLHERRPDGTCTPVAGADDTESSTSSVEFVTTAAAGRVEVGPVTIPGPGTFVAFERLLLDGRVIASHEDCNDLAQTVQAPFPEAPPATTAPPSTTPPATTAPPSTTPPTTTPLTPTPPTAPVPPAPPAQAPPEPVSSARLPRTGSDGPLALAPPALAVVMIGAGLVMTTRRRRPSRERPARDRSNVAPP